MGTVTALVRYFASARAATGVDEEKVQLDAGATVATLVAAIAEQHGPELARVLERCSYLLDEVAVRDRETTLGETPTVDVLPPFAGG
jgi:sulfur-carrier protein